jgi:hypothetical protein
VKQVASATGLQGYPSLLLSLVICVSAGLRNQRAIGGAGEVAVILNVPDCSQKAVNYLEMLGT